MCKHKQTEMFKSHQCIQWRSFQLTQSMGHQGPREYKCNHKRNPLPIHTPEWKQYINHHTCIPSKCICLSMDQLRNFVLKAPQARSQKRSKGNPKDRRPFRHIWPSVQWVIRRSIISLLGHASMHSAFLQPPLPTRASLRWPFRTHFAILLAS
ncbi:predicted protein [Clavispora lusitaniae ATCC 42720]|uniref:Uncharacterized protein n=1 Tax=Clavispora lusitaniae (strain ATCC 42720) TaxID=306902 RepID=C4Y728_CLAL4|nr:uncharacterized protein CLUG_03962 [Clavispora lusitaniae ATCC 42720]EEQ39833.1 predicted protein [Clavispora lusitaniae ATCC 42720]